VIEIIIYAVRERGGGEVGEVEREGGSEERKVELT